MIVVKNAESETVKTQTNLFDSFKQMKTTAYKVL